MKIQDVSEITVIVTKKIYHNKLEEWWNPIHERMDQRGLLKIDMDDQAGNGKTKDIYPYPFPESHVRIEKWKSAYKVVKRVRAAKRDEYDWGHVSNASPTTDDYRDACELDKKTNWKGKPSRKTMDAIVHYGDKGRLE